MKRVPACLCVMLCSLAMGGCAATSSDASLPVDTAANHADAPSATPLAYVGGEAVTGQQMLGPLLEDSGGEVLSEIVLDRAIDQKLAERGIKLTAEEISDEKQRVLATLSPDPNEAARLLERLRQQRGLGTSRFEAMLRRNAGLRRLVKDDITVTPTALHLAYEQTYGPKYQAELIVRPTADQAAKLRKKIEHGASFARLAIEDSTDPSSTQGGLLAPISPADASYPQAIRDALVKLKRQEVSGIIGIDGGFALLKLVRKIEGEKVKFDDVKKQLAEQVRQREKQLRMRQLARRLLKEANVVVLDPTLGKVWQSRRRLLLPPTP